MPPPALSGVVLAGGRSRRMRRNKAKLPVGGVPLWRRQTAVLAGAGAKPVLIALRPRQRSLGAPRREIRDSVADAGPLAGVHAALARASSPLVAVLAVDMPFLEASWFRRLRRACAAGCGAVYRGPRGYEPLAAIYPREALPEAGRRLRRGSRAMHRLVAALVRARHLRVVRLASREIPQAANWNRPADVGGGR